MANTFFGEILPISSRAVDVDDEDDDEEIYEPSRSVCGLVSLEQQCLQAQWLMLFVILRTSLAKEFAHAQFAFFSCN